MRRLRTSAWTITTLAGGLALAASTALAQNPGTYQSLPSTPLPPDLGNLVLGQAPPEAQSLIREVALAAIPPEYENEKQWGKTKSVWNGINVTMDGLRLHTNRKRKEVKQGTWKRYRITFVEPEKNLNLQIVNLRELEPGRAAFDLVIGAKLDIFVQQQEWQRGIRLYSISADALADVEIAIALEMTTELAMDKLPPDVILQPVARNAEVDLKQFKLQRLSKAEGPIIREFGDGLEGILRRQLARNGEDLTEAINRALLKNQDKLRLSVSELVRPRWLDSSADDSMDLIRLPAN